jgi:hypothetical protein
MLPRPWHGSDAPDGGDLRAEILAVYEVVVKSMSGTPALARPQEGFVGARKLGQRLA